MNLHNNEHARPFVYNKIEHSGAALPTLFSADSKGYTVSSKGIRRYTSVNTPFFNCHNSPQLVRSCTLSRFLELTKRRATVGRTPLDGRLVRRRNLYLKTHDTHNIHALDGIRTLNLSRRTTAELRLRQRSPWEGQLQC